MDWVYTPPDVPSSQWVYTLGCCPQCPVGLHPRLVPPAPSGSTPSPGAPSAQWVYTPPGVPSAQWVYTLGCCPQCPVDLHPHLVPPAPSGSTLSPGVPRAQCSDGQGVSSQQLLATFHCITSLVTFLVYMLALAGGLCRCFSTKMAGLTHRDSFVCLPRE